MSQTNGSNQIIEKLIKCVKDAYKPGIKTALWLLKITIPVSFAVLLLDYSGGLEEIAGFTKPFFEMLGLPGVAAIVIITSIFTNIYSVIVVLTILGLPIRDGSILAVMCLISHGFLIETAVLKKTGSNPVRMILLRLTASFVFAWIMSFVWPQTEILKAEYISTLNENFLTVLADWSESMVWTIGKIVFLVIALLILQNALEIFGLIKILVKPLTPLMKVFGLPLNTSFLWLVANTLGLAYGAAVMTNQVDEGKLDKKDADLLNHHIALSHSQLEDPLLFLALGYNMLFLIIPRVILAIAAVWLRRLELVIKRKNENLDYVTETK